MFNPVLYSPDQHLHLQHKLHGSHCCYHQPRNWHRSRAWCLLLDTSHCSLCLDTVPCIPNRMISLPRSIARKIKWREKQYDLLRDAIMLIIALVTNRELRTLLNKHLAWSALPKMPCILDWQVSCRILQRRLSQPPCHIRRNLPLSKATPRCSHRKLSIES